MKIALIFVPLLLISLAFAYTLPGTDFKGDNDMWGNKIINGSSPVNESDFALHSTVINANNSMKSYVDANDTLLHAYTDSSNASMKDYVDAVATGGGLPTIGGTMTGNISMGGKYIYWLASPFNDTSAATKGYVDANDTLLDAAVVAANSSMKNYVDNNDTLLDAAIVSANSSMKSYVDSFDYVSKTGDTMSGALAMGANKVTGLANGTDSQDGVTYSQLLAYAPTIPSIKYTGSAKTFINISGTTVQEYDINGTLIASCETSSGSGIRDIIQNAINRGGTTYLYNGTYDLSTNYITVPKDGTIWTLQGCSKLGVIIKGSGSHVFYYPPTSTYRRTGTLKDLTIDGTTKTANGLTIWSKYCWTTLADNIVIQNCKTGFSINDSVGCNIDDTKITACTNGLEVFGTANVTTTLSVIRPYIDSCTGYGLYVEGLVSGCTFGGTGGVIELNGNPQIQFYRNAVGHPDGNTISGIWLEEDGTNDFIVFNGNTGTSGWYGPVGNVIKGNTFHCGSSVNALVMTRGRRNIFTENICYGSGSTPFTISLGAYTDTNLILNDVTTGSGHWVVSDSGGSNVKTNVAEAE